MSGFAEAKEVGLVAEDDSAQVRSALNAPVAVAAFAAEHDVFDLWAAMGKLAADAVDPIEQRLFSALARVASMRVRPDDWNQPYSPMLPAAADTEPTNILGVSDDDLDVLRAAAPDIPHTGLRARVFDVLSLLAAGRERAEFASQSLAALLSQPIDDEHWPFEHRAWERGLTVAQRRHLRTETEALSKVLRALIRKSAAEYVPVGAARVLREQRAGRDHAGPIARRLLQIARRRGARPETRRVYLGEAAAWFSLAGDPNEAAGAVASEVQSLMSEAEGLVTAGAAGAMRAEHLLELALQRVRAIPVAQRQRLGIENLTSQIARRIREVGVLSLTTFHIFESEPVDLSEAADASRRSVQGKPLDEALLALCIVGPFAHVEEERKRAEEALQNSVMALLTTRMTMSSDGRVIHRSPGTDGPSVYGVPAPVWEEMMRSYRLRIDLYSLGLIGPAWAQAVLEHNPTIGDFAAVAAQTGLVPRDRTLQWARGLYYGWNGDFSSAAQLLAPQIENMVRRHLVDAGAGTSRIDPSSLVESEVGLSRLLERPAIDEIFPADLAFELRALFVSPTGPNLRNEFAHGLASDGVAASAPSMYAWWLALRMIYIPFWNSIHDVEAAEAREPRERNEGEPES